MFKKGKCEQASKCQKFARHLLAWRNADHVIAEEDAKVIRGALGRHDLKSFGYISLESQLANAIKPRKESGVVARKPLKGRKRVDADKQTRKSEGVGKDKN